MRVLHVVNSLELAGAEVLIAELVPRLRARGIQASVAVMQRHATRLEARIEAISGALLFTGLSQPRSPRQVGRLAELFDGFDVIHSHLYPTQLWVALARKLSRAPVKLVTTEHNPDNKRRGKRLWTWVNQWMYCQYDAVVCNSQATADAVAQEFAGSRGTLTVIPNGIDTGAFRPNPIRKGATPLTAIFVARMEPQKDHITLLRGLKLVADLHLRLIGDGSLRSEMESFVAASGLQDRVEFLGWRDDIPALLDAADIYVHATHSDGFAISMAEAMAAGLPVVASNVPGLSWVLGDAGLLCRPQDPEDLAAQLRVLVGSAELRDELGRRGRRRAQEFSIEATVDAHVALYESLVARK